jgi:hypothetical protein
VQSLTKHGTVAKTLMIVELVRGTVLSSADVDVIAAAAVAWRRHVLQLPLLFECLSLLRRRGLSVSSPASVALVMAESSDPRRVGSESVYPFLKSATEDLIAPLAAAGLVSDDERCEELPLVSVVKSVY